MTDSGPGEPLDPTRPPDASNDHRGVERPRFGDDPSTQFRPDDHPAAHTAAPGAPPTGGFAPGGTPAPAQATGVIAAHGRGPWRQYVAPLVAGIVILAGVAFLVVRGGGDSGSLETTDTDPAVTVEPTAEPSDPIVETSPADSVAPDETLRPVVTTLPPAVPTQAQLDDALVDADTLGVGWVEVTFEEGDICLGDDLSDREVGSADVVYQQDVPQLNVTRQISQVVTAYVDAASASAAFTTELAALEACDGTTVEIEGFSYDLVVQSDAFDGDELGEAPCRDQNVSVVAQFSNPDNLVPFIAQALFAFRCGANVVAVATTTTLDLADLTNQVFIDVAGEANVATAALPGSNAG